MRVIKIVYTLILIGLTSCSDLPVPESQDVLMFIEIEDSSDGLKNFRVKHSNLPDGAEVTSRSLVWRQEGKNGVFEIDEISDNEFVSYDRERIRETDYSATLIYNHEGFRWRILTDIVVE